MTRWGAIEGTSLNRSRWISIASRTSRLRRRRAKTQRRRLPVSPMPRSLRRHSLEQKRSLRSHTSHRSALDPTSPPALDLNKPSTHSAVSYLHSKPQKYLHGVQRKRAKKRQRKASFPELEGALISWIHQCKADNQRVTYDLIGDKGRAIAAAMDIGSSTDFEFSIEACLGVDEVEFSDDWITAFVQKHGLKSIGRDRLPVAHPQDALSSALKKISSYSPKCVYSMKSTELFYCLSPDGDSEMHTENKMTILLTVNSDGTHRLPLFFIGQDALPSLPSKGRALELGWQYAFESRAAMTMPLFKDWLRQTDREMEKRKTKMLLLLDPGIDREWMNIRSTWIELLPLPSDGTAAVQPLEAGIIAAFKRRYQRYQLKTALEKCKRGRKGDGDVYSIDRSTAIEWCISAWNEISQGIIQQCFEHTGLFGRIRSTSLLEVACEESSIEDELRDTLKALKMENALSVSETTMPMSEALRRKIEKRKCVDEGSIQGGMEEGRKGRGGGVYSDAECLKAIPGVISLLDVSKPKELAVYKWLRQKQSELRGKTRSAR